MIKLDSVLLFAFIVPFIMGYRLSPGDTPYFLFGLIFFGLFLTILLDILNLEKNLYYKLKHIALWFLIIIVIGSSFAAAIIVRHQTAPIYMIHDIILQQESAIRFLIDGHNPYTSTYFETPLKDWNYSLTEVNPALYHFVMQPFYVTFAVPFYLLSNTFFGYFDGRIPLLLLFFFMLVLSDLLIKDKEKKFIALSFLAFNPATLAYALEGRSDIFMFAFFFFSLFLLERQRFFAASIPMALAFAIKQSAWPVLPFYIAFLYFKTHDLKKTAWSMMIFLSVFLANVLPFFLWEPKAFLDSTVFYLSGNIPNGYPIAGYGFGKLLNQLGFIKDVHQYYPFHIWQLVFGIPLLLYLIQFLKKSPTVSRLVLAYGIFLFVFWYLSRYFNNNHLGYLSMVFLIAYIWPKKDKE